MKKANDPKLLIHYYSDKNTLVLRNEMPAGHGQTAAEHVTASQAKLKSKWNAQFPLPEGEGWGEGVPGVILLYRQMNLRHLSILTVSHGNAHLTLSLV